MVDEADGCARDEAALSGLGNDVGRLPCAETARAQSDFTTNRAGRVRTLLAGDDIISYHVCNDGGPPATRGRLERAGG